MQDKIGQIFDRSLPGGQLAEELADRGDGTWGVVTAPDARKYAVRTDVGTFTGGVKKIVYIGEAKQGATDVALSWRIRQVQRDADGNFLGILWANGRAKFENAWTGHAGLSYS